ncbi:MAG TPA: hypothetical protein VE713_00255, partial [Pyrinomonadaceae bacterium]|nr:hypothetical protein [Pyrinomonadaceae bacterium]
FLCLEEERLTAAGAEFAEEAQRKTDSRFEISNLKTETSKLAASSLKSQRPLCELCASALNCPVLYAQV